MNLLTDNEMLQGVRLTDVKRALPFAGIALILLGLARRSPTGVLLAAVGGGMVYEACAPTTGVASRTKKVCPHSAH